MSLEQPLQRLERNAGRGPRRRVAGRDLACVREARLEGDTGLPLHDRDRDARLREIVGGRSTDYTATEHQDIHRLSSIQPSYEMSDKIMARPQALSLL